MFFFLGKKIEHKSLKTLSFQLTVLVRIFPDTCQSATFIVSTLASSSQHPARPTSIIPMKERVKSSRDTCYQKEECVITVWQVSPCKGSTPAHVTHQQTESASLWSKLEWDCAHLTTLPHQNLKYFYANHERVCWGAPAAPDEHLIISTPAEHTVWSIIKAWGYVLIILLNSDEILKRSP